MFITPTDAKKHVKITEENYHSYKNIIIDKINEALKQENKYTFLLNYLLEIFIKEKMESDLQKNGWKCEIKENCIKGITRISFIEITGK